LCGDEQLPASGGGANARYGTKKFTQSNLRRSCENELQLLIWQSTWVILMPVTRDAPAD
jgi:hypothetical protein